MPRPIPRRGGAPSLRHGLTLCAAALAAGAVAPPPALAQGSEPPRYTIKEELPRTGSNLRRDALTAALPLNQRYEELSPEDRRRFHARYVQLGPGDEPPFPEDGLIAVYGPLHKALRLQRDPRGVLEAIVHVDAAGRATQVEIMSSPTPELAKLTILIGMELRFKPAKCAGVACAMGFPVQLRIRSRL